MLLGCWECSQPLEVLRQPVRMQCTLAERSQVENRNSQRAPCDRERPTARESSKGLHEAMKFKAFSEAAFLEIQTVGWLQS